MGSIMIGSMYAEGGYTGVVILSAAAVMLCIVALIYRKQIMQKIDQRFEKFSNI